MCGRNVVSISAGKYWTALATSTGDVFMWDAKKCKDETPLFTRVHGVKRATSVCVSETHMLVLSSMYHPEYPPKPKIQSKKSIFGGMEELDEDILFDDVQPESGVSGCSGTMSKGIPSLKSLCEKVAIEYLMEPKNAVQLLEVADSLEAKELKKHCEVCYNALLCYGLAILLLHSLISPIVHALILVHVVLILHSSMRCRILLFATLITFSQLHPLQL
jgi:inhibitor of Bruton tyrosine kinase